MPPGINIFRRPITLPVSLRRRRRQLRQPGALERVVQDGDEGIAISDLSGAYYSYFVTSRDLASERNIIVLLAPAFQRRS
nr:hypothetical protein [uncultured Hyphomonas sp.]